MSCSPEFGSKSFVHLSGNPFPFSVLDLSSIAVKSSTAPQGTAQVNRNVNLYVAAPNCDPRDFKINVKGQSS